MKLITKILITLCFLWMAFIFIMSAQSREASSGVSNSVTSYIVDMIYGDEKPKTAQDIGFSVSNEVIEKYLDMGVVPRDNLFGRSKFTFKNDIRKLAHIFLFFVLAVLVNTSFISHFGKNKKLNIAISFCICGLYAVFDEIHQYFVQGRGMETKDVVIDCIGIVIGLVSVAVVCAVMKLIKIIVNKSKKLPE